mgnify:CR=1 FL=1
MLDAFKKFAGFLNEFALTGRSIDCETNEKISKGKIKYLNAAFMLTTSLFFKRLPLFNVDGFLIIR